VLALFLCCQPIFWMSNVALAQSIGDRGLLAGHESDAAVAVPPPALGDDPEVVHAARLLAREAPPQPPVDEPVDPEKYVCGAGDVLQLNFWGLQNFTFRMMIDLEGRAFVPKIGYLQLQGKTLSESRRMIRDSVARFFPRLSSDVTLAEPRSFLVQVADDVVHPGPFRARATDRVATIIARAGGFGSNASKRRVEIRRRDGTVLRADLLLYTRTGDVRHNPYLLDGDVVRVPFADLVATVSGAVNQPGEYELTDTRDLAELLALAGGLSSSATRELPITVVRRLADDRRDLTLVPFTAEGAPPALALRLDDAVRVPEYGEIQQSVVVIGAVQGAAASGTEAPGDEASATRRLPFVKGDSVRTLLARVGGVGPLADLNGAYLVRGGQVLPVDLYPLVMLRDLKADRPVELGDTLVVPFKHRNVLVQGAVFHPGSYPYNPTYRVEQYVALAGGPNRFARSMADLRVITPAGATAPYRDGLTIEPGSSVVVPERNFSRAEIVQIVLSAASVVVSGVAVILATRK